MTTFEATALTDQTAGQQSRPPDAATHAADTSAYAVCASYREAKALAASQRHDGMHTYAVYVVALDRWCVR
ncbi:MAG TPA: hypothetical protein VF898_13595 [Chloroflexota bacterium]